MNREYVHQIYSHLKPAIDKGYKAGIASIVSLSKKKKYADHLHKIDYTSTDKQALRNFKLEAFTVAGVGSYDLEEQLKQIGVMYHEGKIDKTEFELRVRQKMMEYGIGLGDQPPTGWLETNLNTAISSSISAARWNRLNDPEVTDLYPALEYNTQEDDRVREEHMLLDKKTFMKDDPIWDTIYPPNGWNCRCYTTPVAADEMDNYDVSEMTSASQRSELAQDVDPDFGRNSGKTNAIYGKWLKSQLRDMPSGELDELKKLLKEEKF